MGLGQSVSFPAGPPPIWAAVREWLTRNSFPVQLRMIDGELSLPDEQPLDSWQELRVVTPAGMVTLRRDPDRITLVVWGNADRGLLQARNALAAAFADSGGGQIETDGGTLSATQFRGTADLPDGLRGLL